MAVAIRGRPWAVLLWVLLVLCTSGAQVGAAEPRPVVASASELDYPPMCVVEADGTASGFSVELLRAALNAVGRDVTFRVGPWAEVRGWLESGEVAALPLVGRTPEREALYDFTFPYLSAHGVIVVRQDETGIRDLADLRGRAVAVMAGDNAEEFLRREGLEAELRTVPAFEDALRELSAGRHDAVVVQRIVALRLIKMLGLRNLRLVPKVLTDFRQDWCFAVRGGDSDTLALLNEGLAVVMADGTFRRLHARWFAALDLPSSQRLVVGGDRSYPPYEYLDDQGRPAGYNVELTRALAQELGRDVEIRLGAWGDVRSELSSGEIQAVQGMFYSPERAREFDFTPPHALVHHVAVVRRSRGEAPSTEDGLRGLRLVAMRGDIMHDFALEHGLGEGLLAVANQEEALRAVVEGRADCALVARLPARYWIERRGWSEILTVGSRPLLSPEYCFAVPRGQAALASELAEGLKVLKETGEYRRIRSKWLGAYEAGDRDLPAVMRAVATVVGPLVLVLLAVGLWSWTLRRKVDLRTAQLARSQELADRVQALAHIGGFEWDVGRQELFWTDETWRIHGMEPGEVTTAGRALVELSTACYVDEDRVRVAQAFERCVSDGEPYELECRFVSVAGRAMVVRTAGRALRKDGLTVRVVGHIQDVTEVRRAEAKALYHQELLQEVGRIARIGGWEFDPATGQGTWTDEVARIHDLDPEEATDMSRGIGFYHGESRVAIERAIGEAVEFGRPYDLELDLVTGAGNKKRVRTIGRPLMRDGKVVQVRGSFQDVTERHHLELQLRQVQKLESIGRLAGGVAHDYNNMLSVIIGYAQLALDDVAPDSPVRGHLEEILTAARHSSDITRQLLAFARRQTIAPRVLDLNATVEGLLKMLGRLIGENIELVWMPGAGLWPVKMDPTQVDQLMANLTVNARDAITDAGRITIETENLVLDAEYSAGHTGIAPGEYVRLTVSDDGCGMDPGTLERVFEPFFTTKGLGQGTGLGLATVYGIAQQNGGFVTVYSEIDKGTTFRVHLPRGQGEALVEEPEEGLEQPVAKGETVLVVEDEPSIRGLTERILVALGYTVLTAAAPEEALRTAAGHEGEIDLLLSDVVMPEMNGKALAEELMSRRPSLRVLFTSGYTANVIAHLGVLDEGVRFLQKPFTRLALARAVREALDEPALS